jgi:hypothetical protein
VLKENHRRFAKEEGAMSKEQVLDQIETDFEYEGWSVSRTDDGALLLEREGKVYRVEVTEAQPER